MAKDGRLMGGLAALAAIAIIAAAVFSMYPGAFRGSSYSTPSSSPTASSGSSVLGGNQTVLATLAASTMTRPPGTSSTTSASTTSESTASTSTGTSTTSTYSASSSSTSSSSVGGGSYSYTNSSQVEVISVAAVLSQGQGGSEVVTFSVQAKNVGSGDIYVLAGGGSSLNSTIVSGNSLVSTVKSPRCGILEAMIPIAPSGDWASSSPGCWSGFQYQLQQQGTIEVLLELTWTSGTTQGSSNSLVIDATFALS